MAGQMTEDQILLLEQLEEEFKDRYSEEDVKEFNLKLSEEDFVPPVVEDWDIRGQKRSRDDHRGGRYDNRRSDRYDNRDSGRRHDSYDRGYGGRSHDRYNRDRNDHSRDRNDHNRDRNDSKRSRYY